MKSKELDTLFSVIEANYINFFKGYTVDKIKIVKQTWYACFKDIPYDLMLKALQNYLMSVKEYPPTIGAINEQLRKMVYGHIIPAEESFTKVIKLVQRYNEYEKAYKAFSEMEKEVVNKDYFKELGMSTSGLEILKGQYCKYYNSKKEIVKDKQLNSLSDTKVISMAKFKLIEKGE